MASSARPSAAPNSAAKILVRLNRCGWKTAMIRPRAPSAAASAAIDEQFGSNLLSKPYRKAELARRIRAALDAPE